MLKVTLLAASTFFVKTRKPLASAPRDLLIGAR
jgi:hypothetical protein